MPPQRRKQIEDLYRTVLDLPAGERQQYLTDVCGEDIDLRDQVVALFAPHEIMQSSVEAGALHTALTLSDPVPQTEIPEAANYVDPAIGRRLGPYKIVRQIGRGGMGAVYLARRADGEFRQRVAIKLIKRGMDTEIILRRFRNERQILARLDHPYIARLLDGGTTEDGLPYFVMEYIQGLPLYRYCDERKMTIAERLRLYCQVCDAVQYAHRNLVVHRDIKPSNILVTASGIPKLLDFGIAKVLNPELGADITNDATATAMRLMTPEYASPEQVRGNIATPASDVYSLGVLLYELLTGHRPYRLRNLAPHEITRVVCEEEPLPLSSVITSEEDIVSVPSQPGQVPTVSTVCSARSSTIESLRRELSGDPNSIVLKTLRKVPDQRYESVEHLSADITRHLDGRPITAPRYFPQTPVAHSFATDVITSEKSLAVLPFKLIDVHAAGDTGDEYLGIGLADALITRLSSIRRFTVRPTSSVLRYSSPDADPLAAGRELATAFVLDGRIRRVGDSIRITVQLLDVRGSAAIWAGRFDEKFTDVLSLEDAITAQVAEAIVPHLSGDERLRLGRRNTEDPQAHEAYMRGRYHWNSMTEDGLAKSLLSYNRAVAMDPNYALAYAGIADYYNFLGIYAILPFHECAAAAKEAALKAAVLDATLAEAYSALAMATLSHDFDWKNSEQLHRRAIELNPNYANGHIWYSYQLAMSGRFDESLAEVRRAMDLDPLSPLIHHTLTWNLYHARRFEESIAASRRLLSIEPTYGLGHLLLGFKLRYIGERKEAAAEEQKALDTLGRTPFALTLIAAGQAASGERERALALLREVEHLAASRYVSPYLLAMAFCSLGDRARALSELERAWEVKDAWLVWLAVDPLMDPLRAEPACERILNLTSNPLASRLDSGRTQPAYVNAVGNPAVKYEAIPSNGDDRLHAPATPALREEAQQLYTAGRYYAIKRTADGLRQAIERLERAVELDPTFALAYSELADCYALLNWYVEPPPAGAFDRALQAALDAVKADDNLAESHASLGFVKLHYERDWAGAEREFRRAIELKPGNAPAHRWYAFSLSAMGRHEEAIAEIGRATEISPQSAVIATAVANVLFLARRFDESIAQCRKALELDAGAVAAYVVLRWAYELKGMHKEALAAFEQERVFAGDTPTTRAKRAHVLAACGRRAEAREILNDLLARREEQWVTAYEIAVVYSILQDNDNALLWLARADREHAVGFTFIRVDPHLDNIRSDHRFAELLKRVNGTPDETWGKWGNG